MDLPRPDVISTVDLEWFIKMATRTEPDRDQYGMAHDRLYWTPEDSWRTMRLLHAALGLCTEAGEFADQLKKHIFYGKELDRVNLIEEGGDSLWYTRIACDALEVSFQEMLTRNVLKLQKRFPDRFTEHDAQVRDLKGERQILEGGRK